MSEAYDKALRAVASMAPQDEMKERMTGMYSADSLARLECSHLRLIEVCEAIEQSIERPAIILDNMAAAMKQARAIREEVGI